MNLIGGVCLILSERVRVMMSLSRESCGATDVVGHGSNYSLSEDCIRIGLFLYCKVPAGMADWSFFQFRVEFKDDC